MKRSEVLDIIVYYVKENKSILEAYDIADVILSRLEEEGMRPPSYNALMANGKKYNKETDFARDTINIIQWEPENE